MLLYGGIALFMAGLVTLLFGNSFIKEPDKAAKARKQAPLLMLVGAGFLGAWAYVSGALA